MKRIDREAAAEGGHEVPILDWHVVAQIVKRQFNFFKK